MIDKAVPKLRIGDNTLVTINILIGKEDAYKKNKPILTNFIFLLKNSKLLSITKIKKYDIKDLYILFKTLKCQLFYYC